MAPRDEDDEAAGDSFDELLKEAAHVPALALPLPERGSLVSGRFEIVRRLGEGGMGVVYEVWDRERGQKLALKTLVRLDAHGVYRLKNEFRSLSHVVHPNLVGLHELFSDGDQWFFTMDLVAGNDFLHFTKGRSHHDTEAGLRVRRAGRLRVIESAPQAPVDFQAPAFLDALRQLTTGVGAIHAAGKLHRDLKPSNVRVTSEGRVVILDFGLVTDQGAQSDHTTDDGLFGTPAYMAPEQAAGLPATPASDYYAVGVMLYQALTGTLPFEGPVVRVLQDKQQREPQPPSQLNPDVSDALEGLCLDLLRRDPQERPDAKVLLQSLAKLEGGRSLPLPALSLPPGLSMPPAARRTFVGRQSQLQALEGAFTSLRHGRPRLVFVHGQSGMGKTALVRQFVDGLIRENRALVFTGQCYEREAVPFKAFDGIVDELARYLKRLKRHEAMRLLPRDIHSLARVFPVLQRIPWVAQASGRVAHGSTGQLLRRRAFTAIKELLQLITDQRPLVLFIDDLQWSDIDSARLLEELVSPPDPPPLLFIGCYRREEAHASGFLQEVLRLPGSMSSDEVYRRRVSAMLALDVAQQPRRPDAIDAEQPQDVVERLALRSLAHVDVLPVDRLTDRESEGMARCLLPSHVIEARPELANIIAHESEGIPLYVRELVEHATGQQPSADEAEAPPQGRTSLDEVIHHRVSRLPTEAQGLLQTIASAGRPVAQDLALKAAQMAPGDRRSLQLLATSNLIKTRGSAATDAVEVYHDRVRRLVTERMGMDRRRACHRALAVTLEQTGTGGADWLAEQFQAAGMEDRAAEYALEAGDQAKGALAFFRAEELYRWALALFRVQEVAVVRRGALRGAALGMLVGLSVAGFAIALFQADSSLPIRLATLVAGLLFGGPVGMMLGSVVSLLSTSDPEGKVHRSDSGPAP